MEVIVGKTYKHFKGKLYKVICIALDSENINRELVIYEALYDEHKIWSRDYFMFTTKVDKDKYPDCKQEYRFMIYD